MAGYEIVAARPEHLPNVAANMRRRDAYEVWSWCRLGPLDGLRASLKASRLARTALIDGVPEAVWGVARSVSKRHEGRPWFLSTPRLFEAETRGFVRETVPRLRELYEVCPYLENYVWVRNLESIRWLPRLGFRLDFARPIQSWNGELFLRFHGDFLGELLCA
jgi:hypothetical protein